MIIRNVFFIALYVVTLTSCSHLKNTFTEQKPAVGESSVFRTERKPAFVDVQSLDIKKDVTVLDDVQLKTQADYHFALGETYSYEGLVQKAIEEFKNTLVYDPNSNAVKLRLALEYVKVGLVSEAVKYTEDILKNEPKNVEAKMLLGGLYSTLKIFDKAIAQYIEVQKIDPSVIDEANLYLGAIHAEKNDLKKAYDYFTKVTQAKDSKLKHLAHYYMGRIHVFNNKIELSKPQFEKSLKFKPDFVDSVLALGTIHEEQGSSKKAIKLYASFQEQYGPDVSVAKALAQLYLENEDYDRAYRQYEIILANEPQNLSIKIRMALIDIEKKDYTASIKKLKEILAVAPESDKVRFYLAAVYEQIDQIDDAIVEFQKISPDSQFYSESVIHAAYLLRKKKSYDKAIDLVDTALKLKPENPQLYALQASLFDEKKEYTKAEKILLSSVERFKDSDQLFFFLGSIQDKLGKKQEMIASMKKALELNPQHVQALNYLAYSYAELNTNLTQAEELAHKALKLKPNDAYIVDTLGWIKFKQGKYKEAVKYLEAAFELNPTESIIAEHLGDAYYQFELFTKAKDMYERAARVERDESNIRKLQNKIEKIQELLSENNRAPASR